MTTTHTTTHPATHAAPAVEVEDLTVAYHEKPVLWDVDLRVPSGVLMAIVGPNGAGKTTLIKTILGLIPAAAGEVLIHGKPYASASAMCPSAAASTGTSPPVCWTW
jgi:manganese/zinc/iron transport system ATP- binding protein